MLALGSVVLIVVPAVATAPLLMVRAILMSLRWTTSVVLLRSCCVIVPTLVRDFGKVSNLAIAGAFSNSGHLLTRATRLSVAVRRLAILNIWAHTVHWLTLL